jgi:hypothetical protein
VWSGRSGTVASEKLGIDDWFDPALSSRIKDIIKAHPGLNFKFEDVKATGEQWDTSTEKPGGGMKPRGQLNASKAVVAFAVYFKMQEELLREILRNEAETPTLPVQTLEQLPPEKRFTVLRVTVNAGIVPGKKLFLSLAKGGDIPRSGKVTRDPKNPTRTAVLHMARAIHLDQSIFGRPASDYYWPEVKLSEEETAIITELRKQLGNQFRIPHEHGRSGFQF